MIVCVAVVGQQVQKFTLNVLFVESFSAFGRNQSSDWQTKVIYVGEKELRNLE